MKVRKILIRRFGKRKILNNHQTLTSDLYTKGNYIHTYRQVIEFETHGPSGCGENIKQNRTLIIELEINEDLSISKKYFHY